MSLELIALTDACIFRKNRHMDDVQYKISVTSLPTPPKPHAQDAPEIRPSNMPPMD